MKNFYVEEKDSWYYVNTKNYDGSTTIDSYSKEDIYKLLNAIMACLVYRDEPSQTKK